MSVGLALTHAARLAVQQQLPASASLHGGGHDAAIAAALQGSGLPPAAVLAAASSRPDIDAVEALSLEDLLLMEAQLLPQLQMPPGAPAAQALARERCQLLAGRRCANLGCTNAQLLLHGAGSSTDGEAGKPMRCGGCRQVRYCSEACSHADWQRHRRACKALVAVKAASGGATGVELNACGF